jgi:Zn-dependent protease with chaperone function
MARLDQLKLTDDTKLGLVLVILFIFLDTHFSLAFGGWHILHLFIANPVPGDVGLFQNTMLIAIAAAVALARLPARRNLDLLPAASDPPLGALVERVSMMVLKRRVPCYVSANVFDKNAFAAFTPGSSCILLGGGLKLEARRRPEAVASIVAHECAHVKAHDTSILLAAWYLFVAYIALACVELVFSQYVYWSGEHIFVSDPNIRFDPIGFLQTRASMIFNLGTPNFISILGVAIALLHFIKQREYRADELAAQHGFRETLGNLLASHPAPKAPNLLQRLLIRFHPSAGERLRRLSGEAPWASLDWLYIASMAFIVARIQDRTPTLAKAVDLPATGARTANDSLTAVIQAVVDMPDLGRQLVDMAARLLLVFIIALHAYRVAATQTKLGIPFAQRLTIGAEVGSAVMLGTFVASITRAFTIRSLTDAQLPAEFQLTWAAAVDDALYSSFVCVPILLLTIALVILAPWAMRLRAPHRGFRFLALLGSSLLIGIALQVPLNLSLIVLVQYLPHWYAYTGLAALPSSSLRPAPGLPSALELCVISITMYLCLLLLAALASAIAGRWSRRPPRIHPSRLAFDACPVPSA